MARGARSPRSKVRPLLQVFRPLLVSWAGRGDMKTLAGIEEQGMPFPLQRLQLACGYYLNELLLRILPYNDSNITVFARYSESLSALADVTSSAHAKDSEKESQSDAQRDTEIILRQFELELLDTLGLIPDFGCCVVSDSAAATEPEPGQRYHYNPISGEARPDSRATDSGRAVSVPATGDASMLIPVDGASLLALGERSLHDADVLRDAKRIMRSQLALQLGNQPLKSREMIGLYAKTTPSSSGAQRSHEACGS